MNRILLVEDDRSIRHLLLELLAEEGYDVYAVEEGSAGVRAARAIQPDLILMDLMMPVLDGMAATRQLKDEPTTRDIPIIAISAGPNLRIHARDLPADGVVAKPFDIDVLLAMITSQLDQTQQPANQDRRRPIIPFTETI